MAAKYTPLRIIFILLFSFTAFNAIAQPTLPDIAGAADKGIVILSWNCQYSGVKSITVLHSIDSSYNFTAIGKVKKLEKGTQAFVDGHPAAGKNYYRVVILFSSGLNWSSNRCVVNVENSAPGATAMRLPPNDSIQKYIVTTDTAKPGRINAVAEPAPKPVVKDNLSVEPEDDSDEPKQKTKTAIANQDDDEQDSTANTKPSEPKHRIFISFDMDTVTYTIANTKQHKDDMPQHKIITVSFDDPTETTPTFIRSLYVYTDPATGHVDMNLPEDVATHHYSIKFYNDQKEMILEVPRVNASKIIIDKRNFQRRGTYKFILRKDVTELEQGYITIN